MIHTYIPRLPFMPGSGNCRHSFRIPSSLYPTIILTVLCLAFFFFLSPFLTPSLSIPFSEALPCCFLYHFSHANIFHLALNLYALWLYRPRLWTTIISLLIATFIPLVSFLVPSSEALPGLAIPPSLGLSAFLYAAFARSYAYYRTPITIPLLTILAFIPINFLISAIHSSLLHSDSAPAQFSVLLHLLAFLLSYLLWRIHFHLRFHN